MSLLTASAAADQEARDKYDTSPAADLIRKACREDFKYFYLNILDQRGRGLGKLHDFYIDFKRVHELDSLPPRLCHSALRKYLPERKADGFYKERWLYFPTLDAEPEIQDGPDGRLKDMFKAPELWRGVLIRVAGDGKQKCEMMPRGHLKTEIGVSSWPIWELISDSSLRFLIRCETAELASARVMQIENHFEENERFLKYFGNLTPFGKERKVWNQTQMQILCDKRRGREPTLSASGITGSRVGFHYDRMILDDVIGESNSGTPELVSKVRSSVQRMAPLGDPGHHMNDVGTKWCDNDPHSLFTNEEYEQSFDSSFIIATVRDSRNELIWPGYTEPQLNKMRASLKSDFDFFCQFYNQPVAGAMEKFDKQWINWYNVHGDENPIKMVVSRKLDIIMVVDPASTVEKRSDFTACCVIGQSPDGSDRYILGGFRERIKPESMPGIIVAEIAKWQDIAIEAKVSFKFGIETYSFMTFLQGPIKDELRKLGRSAKIHELKPFRKRKNDRIKILMTPFMAGRYHVPARLVQSPVSGEGAAYNLVEMFLREYERFPTGDHDDFLDALAYGEELMRPAQIEAMPEPEKKPLSPDRYYRDVPEGYEERDDERSLRTSLFGRGAMPRYTPNSYTKKRKGRVLVGPRDADTGRYGVGRAR